MASLIKRKLLTGIGWRIDYRIDGQHRSEYLPVGTSSVIARQYLTKIEERLIDAKLRGIPFASPLKHDLPADAGILLSSFTEKYLEFSRAMKAENTFKLDRHSLRLFRAAIGDRALGSITYQDAQDFAVRRLAEVKPASVNVEVRHLKAAFTQAIKWGHLKDNPLKGVQQIRIKNQNFPKFLTREEVRKLLAAIPAGRYRDLIRFYLYTGCRRDEALNLSWDDIDLDRAVVHFTRTKSGSSRAVPLNAEILEFLREMDRTERPFPFLKWFVSHKLKGYMATAGLDPVLHLHSLRHTFASHQVMAGTDLTTVSRLLGHSSTRVTEIYAHLVPDHLRAAADRLQY